jgi:glutathione peroxidase
MPRTLAGALFVALLLVPVAALAAARPVPTGGTVQAPSLYDFKVLTIDGEERSLADYRGKTLLIVNTASRCGFTPQYESLEALYQQYKARGLEVLAFPANDFMGQEPGSNADIKRFCGTQYHTSFPLFAKISVKGKRMAPLYRWLTKDSPFPGDIPWNFTKFVVAPDGQVAARFGPKTDPRSKEVAETLEKLLPALE